MLTVTGPQQAGKPLPAGPQGASVPMEYSSNVPLCYIVVSHPHGGGTIGLKTCSGEDGYTAAMDHLEELKQRPDLREIWVVSLQLATWTFIHRLERTIHGDWIPVQESE